MHKLLLICVFSGLAVFGLYRFKESPQPSNATSSPRLYRCAMHPNYTAAAPGNCPICGMRLQRISNNPAGVITVSDEDQERAGIAITPISKANIRRDVSVPANMILDSPAQLNSPVNGSVTTIAVSSEGSNPAPVKKGQLILVIQPSQDAHLSGVVEVRSPVPAWVTVSLRPNTQVKQGNPIAYYSSVEKLPVIAEIPLDEVDLVKVGTPAEMTSDTDPGRIWRGSVTNILGSFDEKNRAVRVKLEFPNSSLNMRSNMPVHVKINYSGPSVLVVPDQAVLWTGNHWLCYVAGSNHHFSARPLQLGVHFNGLYQIRSGLKLGERVVSQAAFLLDSESRLQPEIVQ